MSNAETSENVRWRMFLKDGCEMMPYRFVKLVDVCLHVFTAMIILLYFFFLRCVEISLAALALLCVPRVQKQAKQAEPD
jgi:hypothetical protein